MAGLRKTLEYLNAVRRRFEATLATARAKAARIDAVPPRSARLREITNFGTNPGNLRMRAYVPNSVPRMRSLVVALHGCTQTADEFDHGTGGPRSPMASGSLSSIPSSSLQIIPRAASLGFCQVTPLVTAAKPSRSVR